MHIQTKVKERETKGNGEAKEKLEASIREKGGHEL